MKLESRISTLIRYWIMTEEARQKANALVTDPLKRGVVHVGPIEPASIQSRPELIPVR